VTGDVYARCSSVEKFAGAFIFFSSLLLRVVVSLVAWPTNPVPVAVQIQFCAMKTMPIQQTWVQFNYQRMNREDMCI
jgi:hypothetical protein